MAEILTLEAGPMSHGGHCIARHDGRVVFLRHAIPGETVRAVVTEGGDGARFWRADAVDILATSDHRRRHPWKQADALRAYDRDQLPVGGAEYGHISDAHQRRLKAHVFRDTMNRIGGISVADLDVPGLCADGDVRAESLNGAESGGLHWRSRVSFAVKDGSLAMKPHRSHDLIALRSMPLAVAAVSDSGIFGWDFSGASSVDVVAPGGAGPLTLLVRSDDPAERDGLANRMAAQAKTSPQVGSVVLISAAESREGSQRGPRGRRRHQQLQPVKVQYSVVAGERMVTEPLPVAFHDDAGAERSQVTLAPEGFWQIHRQAPQALVSAVADLTQLSQGGTMVDLYAGAGLFSAWAAAVVGPQGQVLSVEAAQASSAAAEQLFAGTGRVEVVCAPAERVAPRLQQADLVLLDPPRAGADARVLQGISDSAPGEIIYVSCDPASFARDAKRLQELGWGISDLRLLDMYPNTHHMESVALFRHG
ncbi:class I SAM-dependent RNA methyltransferase [Nesterenkonia massiliensis]|uniref:class I SAM-dependent RNA methyltransferase n=1 Tax=Nesterenkonia massiliensis TaxID=1232429 RepID=UPI000412FD6B|nr:TRAM domain-containing protein [Nesterenkonia massiliensis]